MERIGLDAIAGCGQFFHASCLNLPFAETLVQHFTGLPALKAASASIGDVNIFKPLSNELF